MVAARLNRNQIKTWVHQHVDSLEVRDVSSLMAGMHPDIKIIWPRAEWIGGHQVQAHLKQYFNDTQAVRFYLRRLLIDVPQSAAALVWVGRTIEQNTNVCRQFLGGAALDFNGDGQLYRCQIHLDFDRSGVVSAPEAPWPQEQWSPCQDSSPPLTRAQAGQFLHAYAQAWSTGDAERVAQLLHDEVYSRPPWSFRQGKEAVVAGARYHFANFLNTQVAPRRIIFDQSQPYFGVSQQTFACTNPKTGQRGKDSDFVSFEICQGKLRYWQPYYLQNRR